jgi:hypothetical protein
LVDARSFFVLQKVNAIQTGVEEFSVLCLFNKRIYKTYFVDIADMQAASAQNDCSASTSVENAAIQRALWLRALLYRCKKNDPYRWRQATARSRPLKSLFIVSDKPQSKPSFSEVKNRAMRQPQHCLVIARAVRLVAIQTAFHVLPWRFWQLSRRMDCHGATRLAMTRWGKWAWCVVLRRESRITDIWRSNSRHRYLNAPSSLRGPKVRGNPARPRALRAAFRRMPVAHPGLRVRVGHRHVDCHVFPAEGHHEFPPVAGFNA